MDVSIPLLFLFSVIPDVDVLISGLTHRGPNHSVIIILLLFIPFFITYGKKAVPYLIALIQHPTIGDYITGDAQLLWPITTEWYGTGIPVTSPFNIFTEWTLFLAFLAMIIYTKDAWTLFQHHPSNILLPIPALTVFLPVFLSFPLPVPPALIMPHLTFLTILTIPILIDSQRILRKALREVQEQLR